jgi:hypothetical protein
VKARIQKRIDALYAVFVSNVARNRGMEEAAVRATEAACFTAQEALSNGLADTIGSLDDSLADYAADLCPPEGDEAMSTAKDGTVEAAVHESALAAATATATAAGKTEGVQEGALTERARIKAIRTSEEAAERPVAAESVAMNTDMSVEAARTFLASLPKETTAPAASGTQGNPIFTEVMARTPNPNVGQSAGDEEAGALDPKSADYALMCANAFGVAGLKPALKH